MGKYIRSETRFFRDGRADKADAGEVLEMLGLRKGAHLPKEGMPEQLIQGIRVFVKPYDPKRKGHRAHRIYAHCPCGRDVPVGRLHQHKCHMDSVRQILGDPVPPKFEQFMMISSSLPGLGKSQPVSLKDLYEAGGTIDPEEGSE